jgi:NAD(P)-dependent dehydrogenase (short-subunit alcohol dehydrogenase family)
MALLQNKIALITGGASGIGRVSALALAREGAAVALSDVNIEGGEKTTQMINDTGGKALFVPCDVAQPAEVEVMVKTVIETFGGLDCAINNAGISGEMIGRIHETDDTVFDHIISVNLRGVWLCMKHELRHMMEQKRGVIVNMASVAGLGAAPKGAAYAASKHGVVGLTKTAAVEYAKHGIRVNAVCPAYTDTPMVTNLIEANPIMEQLTLAGIPMKRRGRPEEIAEAVVWLCSDAASFVTGIALAVDGGLTAI